MKAAAWFAVAATLFTTYVTAADFGSIGGPEPANIDEIENVLRQDPYDMELLISFGTSKRVSEYSLVISKTQVLSDSW